MHPSHEPYTHYNVTYSKCLVYTNTQQIAHIIALKEDNRRLYDFGGVNSCFNTCFIML